MLLVCRRWGEEEECRSRRSAAGSRRWKEQEVEGAGGGRIRIMLLTQVQPEYQLCSTKYQVEMRSLSSEQSEQVRGGQGRAGTQSGTLYG